MRVALLGPVRAEGDDGTPIDIGGVRLRMLLARLALDAGRAVSVEALVSGLWGDEAPADAANALQSLVSRLRKALRAAGATIDSTSGGYRIEADVDAHRFEVLVARGRRELAAGCYPEASGSLGGALVLWHGDALADVLDAPFAHAAANRWYELRTGALEDRFDAEVRLGRHLEVLADLESASVAHPLRERLAGLRMRALYAAGRQSEALAVYEEIRGTLAEELGVDPSAELREAHLAVVRGEVAKVAPAVDRLPVRLTSFVGRDDELKLLSELLSGSRLVTLVGPGGAGKTRLATEVATRHPVHESGRVWFVPLAGVRDPGDIAGAVLASLELWEMRRVEDPRALRPPPDTVDRVVEALNAGESMLVLDNCEHLVDAAAQLAHDLLTKVPSLRILATSREPLAIDGETLCPLGPLAVPGESLSVEEATELDAVRLFVDRATAVRPGFVLDMSTLDAVAEICRRLDGMPLAVELAAARLRSMTVGQIAQRLDDRFRLLTSGSRAAMPRQRTLRAVVEWSWDLLDEPERMLARRLSVFPAGADVSAIEAVCADSALSGGEVLYVLGSLVEKSIVDAYSGENGEPRYRMLETIRVYADERLSESDEKPVMLTELARYYVELAEHLESQVRGVEQITAIATFDAEHGTMLSVLRRALDESDVDIAHRLVGSLFWYWVVRGHNGHALTFIEEILRFGDRLPERAAAAFNAIHTLNLSVPGPPADRLQDVPAVIDECVRTGALTHYPGLAIAIPMLAFLQQDRELADRMVRLTLEITDPWSRAAARWVESFILTDAGDIEGAQRARGDALRGFEKVGDRWGTAMTLSMQAESLSQAGDSAGAIAAFEQGLKLATELKAIDDMCQQRWRLAGEYARAGDIDSAWREIEEADRIARAGGNLQLANMAAFGKAEIAIWARDFTQAGALVQQIKAMADGIPFPGDIAGEWVSILEAKLAVEAGRLADAEELLKVAARFTTARRDMPDLARVAELFADVRWQRGAGETAATMLGTSQVIRGTFDAGNPEVRRLVAHLKAELGEQRYAELYRLGAEKSKKDASAWVARMVGIDD
ncbi:BTAD domain-containing putative transcriptional regulator [Amycolatopsis sp.]|uniref:BTAD domain-containing putative transcriptional regulator n=1 Tax=Amycolatopsis sp. TaxID=37632 RepID=UPI002E050017|nr:BTAD domain-containing putative transcriptional regulator [Amycolatopsis sp.]